MKRLSDRLRSLLNERHHASLQNVEEHAALLGVRLDALLDAAERRTFKPPIEVLEAVVKRYGVDPHWLLTGVYDARTHEMAADAMHAPGALRRLLTTMVDRHRMRVRASGPFNPGPLPSGA